MMIQILAGLIILVLPGLALVLSIAPHAASTALERFALALGASLSILPLLYLWAATTELTLTAAILWAALVSSLFIALLFRWRLTVMEPLRANPAAIWYGVIAATTMITLWLRFEQIAGLEFPVWVDSLHHTLLIRVAAELGSAPYSLRPYLPVDTLTYHWGYHVSMATLARLIGIAIPDGLPHFILWSGQLLSALIVPVYAALAIRLWRHPIAGATAGIVVGLISVMPAYYVSWGRYTLLTGMLMLPAALLAADTLRRRPTPGMALLLALLLAGLSLVHFVVFALALLGCAIMAGALALPQWRRATGWMLAAGCMAALFTMPWLLRLFEQALPGTGSSAMHVAGNTSYNALPEGLLWAGTNRMLLALAGIGALLALWRRHTTAAWLIIWCAAAVLLANPVVIGLPYLSFLNNEILTITMFAPLALLIGGGMAQLAARAPTAGRRAWTFHGIALALAIGSVLWGIGHWRAIIRPDTILAGAADRAAIEWVARNTPTNARFVVSATGWLYDVDRGVDGGWWLLPLAGRPVSTPPVIYNYAEPAEVAAIKRDSAWLRDYGVTATAEQLTIFMRERGYQYVYTSERPGAIRAAPLRESAVFEELYTADGIAIFRLRE